jgi:hypothetical protein
MNQYLIFNRYTGEVIRALRCSAFQAKHQASRSDEDIIQFSGDIDPSHLDRLYVYGGVVLERTVRPTPAHEWSAVNHEWVFSPDLMYAAKELAWQRIKQKRESAEFGSFVWSGHTFDADSESQRRIQGAVQLASIAQVSGAQWSIVWTLADNSTIELTAAEMIGVGMALANSVASAHATARQLRAQIMQSQTLEDLDTVVWPT